MKKIIAASVLPVGALLAYATPSGAAPGAVDSASTTINQLRAQGFDVRISRVGTAPLEQCSVSGVRNHPVPRQPFVINDDDDINVFRVAPTPKVTVTLDCTT
ncbi:hypothetical protein CRI77_09920 [Mycolicibacterium duvalii]|uniref:Uncharacterized protein n=1 Tax=Mycolicibacterium duvalii TaxID=39688 RepID=A0A7I7KB13_9MYCO|nr:hypothetical protein [Mycolicibacterium duvalii]MCV7368457.1 hypothetical protein [Mycolicibacterium duvalii]PEG41876.1 hypothetical protein CRI77_09920 [Mycolicibacterium duvalii]BBX20562.1 hypothetical protein MDUV_54220 [Mycolicibacterium duvalii]